MLCGLGFVPTDRVFDVYIILARNISPIFAPFLLYLQSTYVGSRDPLGQYQAGSYGLAEWNVFERTKIGRFSYVLRV